MAVNVVAWQGWAKDITGNVSKNMYGVEKVIELCLIALVTGGHVLLEGNPGLGKTALINALSDALTLPFNRIQFTPDLMPQDITGTFMPSFRQTDTDNEQLRFTPGPIFTALLLADEINRATPKTQSAMLEAMGESKVTVLGKTFLIDEQSFRQEEDPIVKDRPFMVAATQNPIDHEGTYALPEAQSDRFMFKVLMPTPDADIISLILEKTTDFADRTTSRLSGAEEQLLSEADEKAQKEKDLQVRIAEVKKTVQKLKQLKNDVLRMDADEFLKPHILNIILASNGRFDELTPLSERNSLAHLRKMQSYIRYGLGPRAATAMMLGAKAHSLLFLDNNNRATAFHQSLAHIVIPALRHRLQLRFDWTEHFANELDKADQDPELYRDKFIRDFVMACMPRSAKLGNLALELNNIVDKRPF